MKVWTSQEKADDRIIVFAGQTIYKGNPKAADMDAVLLELDIKKTVPASLPGFPLNYIREINLQQGKRYIELAFGKDSTEELKITDENKRREVFEYFKHNIPGSVFSRYSPSILQAGKKPLIAAIVVTLIFSWTLYIAAGIESGNDYDVSGKHYNSIAGIVLAIASLGVKKVILIFDTLLAVSIFAFVKKVRTPVSIDRLTLK